MRPIGKIGVRSSGPAGCPVAADSGGSGSPGSSGARLTQCVGMSRSVRRNLVGSVMARSYGGARTGRGRVIVGMRRQPAPDLIIAAIAERQGGVVARAQLIARGLSAQAIDRRVRAGRLHILYRGVYAVGHRVVGAVGRRWAAVLA